MLNIEKYKDEIIEEYQNLLKNFDNDSDGKRMNKAIKTIAFKHYGKLLHGASSPFKWLCEEYKEPILDEAERKYLSDVIRPFRKEINTISKFQTWDESSQYIYISMKDNHIATLPVFPKGTMYKGMEGGKHYSLKELGL